LKIWHSVLTDTASPPQSRITSTIAGERTKQMRALSSVGEVHPPETPTGCFPPGTRLMVSADGFSASS
jgi:hypothetical protein